MLLDIGDLPRCFTGKMMVLEGRIKDGKTFWNPICIRSYSFVVWLWHILARDYRLCLSYLSWFQYDLFFNVCFIRGLDLDWGRLAEASPLFLWERVFAVFTWCFSFFFDSAAMFVKGNEWFNYQPHFMVILFLMCDAYEHIFDFYVVIFLLLADSYKSPESAFSLVVFPWSCAMSLQMKFSGKGLVAWRPSCSLCLLMYAFNKRIFLRRVV